MDLKLDSDAINKYVSNAILESVIGKNIKEQANKALSNLISGYNSPFEKEVREALQSEIKRSLALPENQEVIRQTVSKLLTESTLQTLTEYAAKKLNEDIKDYRKGY